MGALCILLQLISTALVASTSVDNVPCARVLAPEDGLVSFQPDVPSEHGDHRLGAPLIPLGRMVDDGLNVLCCA